MSPDNFSCFGGGALRTIGGYVPHKAGGIDWIAVTTARMIRLEDALVPREVVLPPPEPWARRSGAGCASAFSYGQKDYYLGRSPAVGAVQGRLIGWPNDLYLLGGLARGAGIRLGVAEPDRPSQSPPT